MKIVLNKGTDLFFDDEIFQGNVQIEMYTSIYENSSDWLDEEQVRQIRDHLNKLLGDG